MRDAAAAAHKATHVCLKQPCVFCLLEARKPIPADALVTAHRGLPTLTQDARQAMRAYRQLSWQGRDIIQAMMRAMLQSERHRRQQKRRVRGDMRRVI